METTPFFLFLFVHLSSLILGFGAVMVTDLYGLLWIRDRIRFPQLVKVSGETERFIWAGWAGMVAAGIPLLLLKGVVDDLMIVKLFFVALIGVNGLALHWLHKQVEHYRDGDDIPRLLMFRLVLSLAVSQFGWWSAMVIGFLHRHVQSIIEWPDAPWLVSAFILTTILVLWAGGEAVLRREAQA